jgi:hypothetical protein
MTAAAASMKPAVKLKETICFFQLQNPHHRLPQTAMEQRSDWLRPVWGRRHQTADHLLSKSRDGFFQGRPTHPPVSRMKDRLTPPSGWPGNRLIHCQPLPSACDKKVRLTQIEKVGKNSSELRHRSPRSCSAADQPVQVGQAGHEPRLGIGFRPVLRC